MSRCMPRAGWLAVPDRADHVHHPDAASRRGADRRDDGPVLLADVADFQVPAEPVGIGHRQRGLAASDLHEPVP